MGAYPDSYFWPTHPRSSTQAEVVIARTNFNYTEAPIRLDNGITAAYCGGQLD
jgi:hypothetical protein